MKACIILHNMIVEDERDSYDLTFDYDHVEDSILEPIVQRDPRSCYMAYLRRVVQIRDPDLHARLQLILMQEIWSDIRRDKDHNCSCYVLSRP